MVCVRVRVSLFAGVRVPDLQGHGCFEPALPQSLIFPCPPLNILALPSRASVSSSHSPSKVQTPRSTDTCSSSQRLSPSPPCSDCLMK